MHSLTKLHDGGHLYGPGGMGWREYDPAQHLGGSEEIVETRDLPGFVTDRVTYESHHFWIHFCRYKRDPDAPARAERLDRLRSQNRHDHHRLIRQQASFPASPVNP